MSYSSSAPKNVFQQKLHNTSRESISPKDEADRITYGVISKVNYDIGQVKVKRLLEDGKVGDLISDGFLPLSTPISDIHLRFGALREGLVVRIYYKGKLSPKDVIIEVIGDEDFKFLSKEPVQNEIVIGPHKIFSAGMF